jgi:hypothetical protein
MTPADLSRKLRCPPCSHVRHDLCQGRETGCRCAQCPGRYAEILADARRRADTANDTGLLRDSLNELIALAVQRYIRLGQIQSLPPVPAVCSGCGKKITQSRFGRKRRWCSEKCKNRARRERAAERAREARDVPHSAASPASPAPAPAASAQARKAAPWPERVPVPSPVPDFATPGSSALARYLHTGRSL